MKKYILGFLLFAVATTTVSAQTEQELKDLALAQATITSSATVNGDMSTVLDFTFPGVLELMGGKEAALTTVNEAMAGMKQGGMSFQSSEVTGLVGFAQEEDEYRCIIENKVVIDSPEQQIKSTSYMLGIYSQEAKQWYFMEAAQLKNEALREMVIPGFKTSLVIPDDVREFVPKN